MAIIDLYVICYNEIKILPFAFQYWKQNFNHVYVLDNGSIDGSIEYLQQFPDFISICYFDTNNTFNDDTHVIIKNELWKKCDYYRDFVVTSDMDEFIYSSDLQAELQYMLNNNMTIAILEGYEMITDKFPIFNNNKLSHEIIQLGKKNQWLCKPILFNPNKINEMFFSLGAHLCKPEGEIKYYDRNNIFLLHHKFLSIDYLKEKYYILNSRMDNKLKDKGINYHLNKSDEEIIQLFNSEKNEAINILDILNNNKNIIANDSTGGYIYQRYNKQYNNPFIQDWIFLSDFIKLIEYYDTINFNNYQIIVSNDNKFLKKNCICIIIDNLVKVYYPHYIYDENIDDFVNKSNFIYSKNIKQYVSNIYEKRLYRLLSKNINPIFIYNETFETYDCDIFKLINLNLKYKCIILVTDKSLENFSNNNLYITCKYNYNIKNATLVDNILNNKNILNFIQINKPKYSDVIVSLASHGKRLQYVYYVINSLLNQTIKPYKIILNIFNDDYKNISYELSQLISSNNIELHIENLNIKSHQKYYYAMSTYKSRPIILCDDDMIYDIDFIESLYMSYIKNPNIISARRVHKMFFEDNQVVPYEYWWYEYTLEEEPSNELFFTSGAGTIFPPNILNINSDILENIYKCITADDILLNYIANKNKIKIKWVKNTKLMNNIIDIANNIDPLCIINKDNNKNSDYLKIFKINKN